MEFVKDGMVMASDEEAATRCEAALRSVMRYVYRDTYGEAWLEEVSNKQQRGVWRSRRDKDGSGPRSRKGVVGLPEDEFAYSQFSDLLKIAENHWSPLAPVFPDKAEVLVFFRRFNELRNPSLHGRPIYQHESQLLQGIAGQVRNQVTVFMSSKNQAGDYYPKIENIWDSLGYRYECGPADAQHMGTVHHTGTVVRPGDQLTLSGTAIDPQDRPLLWHASSNRSGAIKRSSATASGERVDFEWSVSNDDVAEQNWLTFILTAEGTPFHREGDHDFRLTLSYCVRPPSE